MSWNHFLETEKANILRDINDLIAIKSVHGEKKECTEALYFVVNRAKEFGLITHVGKKEDFAVIELGEGDTTVGILVHVDVVEPGDLNNWSGDPFTLFENDDFYFGRGIVDDKGPVITNLYVLKYLKSLGKKFNKKIQLIVGTMEEGVWTDIDSFKEEFPCPDYGYSPDGDFPIFNREKGYMDVELHFKETLPEGVSDFESGISVNSVPSMATYVENGAKIEFPGLAAHSSTPELGTNSIVLLANAVNEKYDLNFAKFITDYFPLRNFESLLPLEKMDPNEGIIGEDTIETTIVPTVMEMEENGVMVNFNVRHRTGTKGKDITDVLEKYKEEYRFDIKVAELLEPIYVPEDQAWLKNMADAFNENGGESKFMLAGGCSYAKSMPNFVSWGPIFQGEIDCAHMEDEMLRKTHMWLGMKIFADFLMKEVF